MGQGFLRFQGETIDGFPFPINGFPVLATNSREFSEIVCRLIDGETSGFPVFKTHPTEAWFPWSLTAQGQDLCIERSGFQIFQMFFLSLSLANSKAISGKSRYGVLLSPLVFDLDGWVGWSNLFRGPSASCQLDQLAATSSHSATI